MKFTYEELIELGFNRDYSHDPVFERENGYEYFVVWMDLPKGFTLEWDIEDKTLTLLNCDIKSGTILSKMQIKSRAMLEQVIEFLNPITSRKYRTIDTDA